MARAEQRKTCTDHCAHCGRHFHSLGAYDAHLWEGEHVDPTAVTNSKGKAVAQVWTEDGWCSLAKGCREEGQIVKWQHPVTIYQGIPSAASVEFFAKQHSG